MRPASDRAIDAASGLAGASATAPPAARPGGTAGERRRTHALDRSFDAPAHNRRWTADFTYIWTAGAWLYVAAVIDLFSRRVVGWSMSASMTAQLVTDALVMAIWRRGKPDHLLHHSDRGSQYTSDQFQRLMADHGVTCSMSRSGNVWDNAAMESFFSSLKTERTARKVYRSRDDRNVSTEAAIAFLKRHLAP
jgi:putative transposase